MPRKLPSTELTTFGKVVRSQGRTYNWLAERSGYGDQTNYRVASGRHPGTLAFHKAMCRILAVRYKLPSGVWS